MQQRPSPSKHRLPAVILAAVFLALAGCDSVQENTASLEAQLQTARDAIDSLNFNRASEIYAVVYPGIPEDDAHWAEAAYGYASSLWHQTPSTESATQAAAALFTRVAEVLPGTDWDYAARLSVARIHMIRDYPGDAENPAAAIQMLEDLIGEASGYVRDEAVLRLAECHRMDVTSEESIAKARAILSEWLQTHPESPLASSMWEQIGWMDLLDFKQPQQALHAFIQAEKLGLADPSRKSVILWRIGDLAETLGEPATAARYYRKLILEAPTSGRGYDAQLAMQRMRETLPGMENLAIPELKLGGGL